MRILCDRHHAGLLYSLQLLFEDRLGMELYVPVGLEWWAEGYWRFGEVFGDDRLAQQYLAEPEAHGWDLKFEHHGPYWETRDVEFPERLIYGLELEDFRGMEFDYVLASVQENQRGFHRLAKEVGAHYVLQVGNRGQQVDWDLDPSAIVSAEAPIRGRGVMYHQEYSKDDVFRFADPALADRFVARSFVNCFDSIHTEYALFQRFRAEAESLVGWKGGFKCTVHGHDGEHGLVHPTTAIAARMSSAGWAYHDKPQGDGFGHVIHYWASVGRPLIGHASYYNGLMPGPLWEDGVTAINLDHRTPEEAARLVMEIAYDPPRHFDMCLTIRERLDGLVNFEREAADIASLLGL